MSLLDQFRRPDTRPQTVRNQVEPDALQTSGTNPSDSQNTDDLIVDPAADMIDDQAVEEAA